jgi:hypothetical protein
VRYPIHDLITKNSIPVRIYPQMARDAQQEVFKEKSASIPILIGPDRVVITALEIIEFINPRRTQIDSHQTQVFNHLGLAGYSLHQVSLRNSKHFLELNISD